MNALITKLRRIITVVQLAEYNDGFGNSRETRQEVINSRKQLEKVLTLLETAITEMVEAATQLAYISKTKPGQY